MSNDALVPAPIAQAIAKREAETPQSAKVTRLAALGLLRSRKQSLCQS